jgi:hypothetical protein
MGAKVVNVDVTFGLHEQAQQPSASLTMLAQNREKTVRKDAVKSQSMQSSVLPIVEPTVSHSIQQTGKPELKDESYLVFMNKQDLEASGHSADTLLLIPSCAPFKATAHPFRRLLSTFGMQNQDKKYDGPRIDLNKVGGIFDYSFTDICALLVAFTVYAAIIGIVGGISRFRRGDSTLAQRTWVMTWLAIGLVYFLYLRALAIGASWRGSGAWAIVAGITHFILAAPAIGGFVVVGQMIWAYGNCTALS